MRAGVIRFVFVLDLKGRVRRVEPLGGDVVRVDCSSDL